MGRKSKSAYDTRDRQGQAAFNQVAAGTSGGLYRELKEVYLLSTELTTYFDASGLGLSSAVYSGWAICNGENGTPDLDGKFPRFNAAGAGTEGGSDTDEHGHTSDAGSAHDHGLGSHTHAMEVHKHSLVGGGACIRPITTVMYMNNVVGPNFTATHQVQPLPAVASFGSASQASTPLIGDTAVSSAGDTGAASGDTAEESAHTHAIGAPSTTENRPAYYEVVPLMWVG